MDVVKMKWKKNVFVKAWERCVSLGTGGGGNKSSGNSNCDALRKSKSWHCTSTTTGRSFSTSSSSALEEDNKKGKKKRQVAPEGCFSVYVGPQRQKFVVKTEFANHPLFKMLLEDAEDEYGFRSEGPLQLPCDVDLFYKVLAEMDSGEEISPVCSFGYSPLILCSPSRRLHSSYGSYKLLTPSRLLKLNSSC
ncbi:Auxin responsive SAUR protein [Corchorus olitorius]|uniref:Auxin responsive SAUR protein n=1 Tax=Corchorus olitorius TaxID=93759 RepID=A0A1R3JG63_9ROSI|nr:Auxin responsive SAUR protein [Corchorus olitorius]